ncbi:hypothetical protein [Pelobacter seleniigenes]|uniref:hypothetical protein n=1 Tax=Pelobacter seleniigenes TaxID=407188 RepID=UPI0012B8ECF7|nr:hypothetical protein [Pelobacter seleniigenes]
MFFSEHLNFSGALFFAVYLKKMERGAMADPHFNPIAGLFTWLWKGIIFWGMSENPAELTC